MNQRHFTDHTFNLALSRARAAEAEFIKQAAAAKGPKPSEDLHDMIDRLAKERMSKALAY